MSESSYAELATQIVIALIENTNTLVGNGTADNATKSVVEAYKAIHDVIREKG